MSGLPGGEFNIFFRKGRNMFRKIGLVVGILLLTVSYSSAGNVQTFGVGASATAQAEAVSAYSDDPFAVYYNPAGLVLTKRSVISTGFMGYSPNIEVEGFSAWGTDSDTGAQVDLNAKNGAASAYELSNSDVIIPHMGYATPVNEKLFFGIAAYNPYGLHVNWSKNPSQNPGAAYAWESYYGRMVVTPSLAYKVNDKLSFGFGISLGQSVSEAGKTFKRSNGTIQGLSTSAINAGQAAQLAAAAAQAATIAGDDAAAAVAMAQALEYGALATKAGGAAQLYTTLNGAALKLEAKDDFNYSFNAGVMYRPIDEISLGLTYRGRTDTKFEGDTKVIGATSLATGEKINLGGSVTMEYDHPESVQAGIRYFASKNLSVEFDMTWTRWSILDNQVENITLNNVPMRDADGNPIIVPAVSVPAAHARDWDDTLQYKIGAEWQAAENIAFRAGYTYDPTPIPDHTFDIGWPDTDRNVYNVGCGLNVTKNWVLDTVLEYVVSTSWRSIEGQSSELNHEYTSVYGEVPGDEVHVSMKDKGTLWGFGLTLSYLF